MCEQIFDNLGNTEINASKYTSHEKIYDRVDFDIDLTGKAMKFRDVREAQRIVFDVMKVGDPHHYLQFDIEATFGDITGYSRMHGPYKDGVAPNIHDKDTVTHIKCIFKLQRDKSEPERNDLESLLKSVGGFRLRAEKLCAEAEKNQGDPLLGLFSK